MSFSKETLLKLCTYWRLACQDFHQNIEVPPVGTHVELTGSYVLDKEHGNWAEIHPVTSITTIP